LRETPKFKIDSHLNKYKQTIKWNSKIAIIAIESYQYQNLDIGKINIGEIKYVKNVKEDIIKIGENIIKK